MIDHVRKGVTATTLEWFAVTGPGRPESAVRETPPPDNKSRVYCCHNSLPAVINPNNNMTQQHCMKRIYAKIHKKSQPSRVPLSTCLHFDVTELAWTTGIVDLQNLSWRVREREERRQVRKRVFCRFRNRLYEVNHHKHFWDYFWESKSLV